MNKCEWKDGEFKSCKPALGYLNEKINCVEGRDFNRDNFEYSINEGIVMGDQYFSFCPFCGASLKKPVVVEVGMFGVGTGNKGPEWGIVTEVIRLSDKECVNEVYFNARGKNNIKYNFTPGLPTGFNQDGTPKEIT